MSSLSRFCGSCSAISASFVNRDSCCWSAEGSGRGRKLSRVTVFGSAGCHQLGKYRCNFPRRGAFAMCSSLLSMAQQHVYVLYHAFCIFRVAQCQKAAKVSMLPKDLVCPVLGESASESSLSLVLPTFQTAEVRSYARKPRHEWAGTSARL